MDRSAPPTPRPARGGDGDDGGPRRPRQRQVRRKQPRSKPEAAAGATDGTPHAVADYNWKKLLQKGTVGRKRPAPIQDDSVHNNNKKSSKRNKKSTNAANKVDDNETSTSSKQQSTPSDDRRASKLASRGKPVLRRLDDATNREIINQAAALHSSLSRKRTFRAILARVQSRGTLADQIAAIDCEMVGVGKRKQSELARVTIVDGSGSVLLDQFVRPVHAVTDYRTWVSGIRKQDLVGAPVLSDVRQKVLDLLRSRPIVVGHSIANDLRALKLEHVFPQSRIRDTATFRPLARLDGRPRSLRELVAEHTGVEIQTGQHSSLDDARATLYLYLMNMLVWERELERDKGTDTELK